MTEVGANTGRSPEERLEEVKTLVFELGSVRIEQLAADFGVSEMTIGGTSTSLRFWVLPTESGVDPSRSGLSPGTVVDSRTIQQS